MLLWPETIIISIITITLESCCVLINLHKSLLVISAASSTLSISPCHLREISDPISLLLCQLHKLIYISQLPPSQKPSARRTLVEHYKRSLFNSSSDPSNLKSELHKLSCGVTESVPVLSEAGSRRMVQRCMEEISRGEAGHQMCVADEDITYEQLQAIVNSLAEEHGYSLHVWMSHNQFSMYVTFCKHKFSI